MKFAYALCFLSLVALTTADGYPYPNGCIYVNGRCYKGCPDGTYSYTTGCRQLMREPTCEEPNPALGGGNVCDYSACYCNPPTVRNSVTNQCVHLTDCPKKE